MLAVGLDPSGKEGNPSGIALIRDGALLVYTEFRKERFLIEYILSLSPDIVAIDAPLGFPKSGAYRDCDLALRKMGLRPLPLNMGAMRMLISRAIKIRRILERSGISVIETFPAGSLRVLGYKRKPRNIGERRRVLRDILSRFGIKNIFRGSLSKDKFDAVLCALVGWQYLSSVPLTIRGDECEIYLVRP